MTKPPNKHRAESSSTPSELAEPESRAKPTSDKPTIVDTLLANTHAYGDDEIKVWVQAQLPDHPPEFFTALAQHLEEIGFFIVPHEVLEVNEAAPLPAGQWFLLFRASDPNNIRADFGRVSEEQPVLAFQDVSFTPYAPTRSYCGSKIGDTRLLIAAAKRALKETNGQDWFGGLAEFAQKYLEPLPSRKKVLQ